MWLYSCTPALPVTQSAAAAAVYCLWCCINDRLLPCTFTFQVIGSPLCRHQLGGGLDAGLTAQNAQSVYYWVKIGINMQSKTPVIRRRLTHGAMPKSVRCRLVCFQRRSSISMEFFGRLYTWFGPQLKASVKNILVCTPLINTRLAH